MTAGPSDSAAHGPEIDHADSVTFLPFNQRQRHVCFGQARHERFETVRWKRIRREGGTREITRSERGQPQTLIGDDVAREIRVATGIHVYGQQAELHAFCEVA